MSDCHLILFRHVETTWHVEHRVQGRADSPLTDVGHQQAAAVRGVLRGFAPTSVQTSDLGRAVESARLMGFEVAHVDPVWSESDFGEWTGRTEAELRAESADDHQSWRVGRFDPPGGEPFSALRARVTAAAGALGPGDHVVVTHGGVIRALLSGLLDLDLATVVPVACAHAVVIRLDERPRLLGYNVPAEGLLPLLLP